MGPSAIKTKNNNYLAVVAIAVVLALILGVAWYAIARKDGARNTGAEATTPETSIKSFKTQDEYMTQVPSEVLAVAGSQYSASTAISSSTSSDENPSSQSVAEEKRKTSGAYREALACRKYLYAKKQLAEIAIPKVYSARDLTEIQRQLDEADEALLRNQGRCDGASLETISDELFERSLRAGLQGDLGAQSCFVVGTLFETMKLRRDAVQEQQFMANAPRFLERGIKEGYWPLVWVAVGRLLDTSGQLPPWLMALPKPDPFKVYRSVRLVYYRSDSDGTAALEHTMKSLEERYHFSSQELALADRWAQQAYQNRFADTEPLDIEHTKGCQ